MLKINKLVFKTIILTLFVEILITSIFSWIFYYNYKTFASANSWISEKKIIKSIDELKILNKKLVINSAINDDNNYYNWALWNLSKSVIKDTNNNFNEIITQNFYLNQNEIKKEIIINILKNDKVLDKYTYKYLSSIESEKFIIELNNFFNFQIILWIISIENIDIYNNEWNNYFNKFIDDSNSLINNSNYDLLSTKLSELEKKYNNIDNLNDIILDESSLLNSISVQYVLNKLLNDEDYNKHINEVSEVLWIDKFLLISAIWVEQIRYMTTARWYAKTMIMDNKYLTNFSQFSYWIWWIKVETSKKILSDLKTSNTKIYDEYFKQDENLSDSDLISNLQDKFRWILYAWALVYNIQNRWKTEWFDLENQPWITITLYNMWNEENKKPNADPKLWWSLINIEWKQLYFWEIWYIMFYYLKYYVEE